MVYKLIITHVLCNSQITLCVAYCSSVSTVILMDLVYPVATLCMTLYSVGQGKTDLLLEYQGTYSQIDLPDAWFL